MFCGLLLLFGGMRTGSKYDGMGARWIYSIRLSFGAIIHNSDYASVQECMAAIDRYFEGNYSAV